MAIEILSELLYRELGDEFVVLDVNGGEFFSADPVAIHLWELIQTHKDENSVIAAMQAEYDVDESRLRADLTKFLDLLIRHEIIRLTG
jgi:hypothetical protein